MKGSIFEIKYNKYGFITADDNTNVFFHKTDLKNCNIRQLEGGDKVEFELTTDCSGRPVAKNVRMLYQASSELKIANPGINPSVCFDHFNEEEESIVKLLGKWFYVTSGGEEITVGVSSYKYCLIKPTDYYCTTFQLSREIVVIFSDYVSFEPRSLDAVSAVYKRIPSALRLDRGCYILICHDDEIENKIYALLKDSNLNQIIVPFSYKELLKNPTEVKIQERFKKYLFDTDLFSTVAPITNAIFFFGRRDFAHDIASKCKKNAHSGVFGLRRSGKTSLLYAVKNILEQQSFQTVFIPCESDLSSLDWRTALCKVVLNIYQELGFDNSKIHEVDYQSDNTAIYFEEDLFDCLNECRTPVTLMFDEIEAITFGVGQGEKSKNLWYDGENFVNFWNIIKGYCSKHPTQISILIAGTNPMINEVPVIGAEKNPNPMFKQLSETNQGAYLQAFKNEDTNSMVNTLGGYMGLNFDEYSVAKLTSDCGGHPYLIRLLCSHINKYVRAQNIPRPVTITKAIYDKAVKEFEKSSEAISFFQMVLNILMNSYEREFNALKILALQGDDTISQIQDRDSLSHLIGYGLVECNNNHYAIKYNTIKRFLLGEYRFERTGLSIDEQKEEINFRINKAEISLRRLVRTSLSLAYGTDDAKKKIISSMEKHKAINKKDLEKAKDMTYQQLFDPSQNKMYFSLLEAIILNNQSAFSNVFEGCKESEIIENLDAINLSRRCPDHAFTEQSKNWTWDNFLSFRKGIEWLENILVNFD